MIYLLPKEPSMEVIKKRLAYYRTKTNGVPSVYVRDIEYLLRRLERERKTISERPAGILAKR